MDFRPFEITLTAASGTGGQLNRQKLPTDCKRIAGLIIHTTITGTQAATQSQVGQVSVVADSGRNPLVADRRVHGILSGGNITTKRSSWVNDAIDIDHPYTDGEHINIVYKDYGIVTGANTLNVHLVFILELK